MLSLEVVDEAVLLALMRELSVPERRRKVAVVFLGEGLGRAGCGRSSSSDLLERSTAVLAAGRKQLINIVVGVLLDLIVEREMYDVCVQSKG